MSSAFFDDSQELRKVLSGFLAVAVGGICIVFCYFFCDQCSFFDGFKVPGAHSVVAGEDFQLAGYVADVPGTDVACEDVGCHLVGMVDGADHSCEAGSEPGGVASPSLAGFCPLTKPDGNEGEEYWEEKVSRGELRDFWKALAWLYHMHTFLIIVCIAWCAVERNAYFAISWPWKKGK